MNQNSTQLGKYTILEKIGEGGFGTVYRAQDTTLERLVALKVLKPMLLADPVFVERFRREAKAAAVLEHPHIVTIYEVGQDQGMHYLAMRYLGNDSLAALIARQGALPIPRVLHLARQIADALDYAHARGMIHRDVKPSNILVSAGDIATLTDFGLVRSIEGSVLSSSQQMAGTVEYMAPEQLDTERANEIGARTDLYAFGVLVYQLVTGRVPFSGATSAVMAAHLFKDPPRPSQFRADLPLAIEAAILKMLAKQSGERFASGKDFVDALERTNPNVIPTPQEKPSSAKPPPPPLPRQDLPAPLGSENPPTQALRPSLLNTCALIAVLALCLVFGALGFLGVVSNTVLATPKPPIVLSNASPYQWAKVAPISTGRAIEANLNVSKRSQILRVYAEVKNDLPTNISAHASPDCRTWEPLGTVHISADKELRPVVIYASKSIYVNGKFCISLQADLGTNASLAQNNTDQHLIQISLSNE